MINELSVPEVLVHLNRKIKIISGFAALIFCEHLCYLVYLNATRKDRIANEYHFS